MWNSLPRTPVLLITAIELIGSAVIVFYVLKALAEIARRRPTQLVRLTIAEGIVAGLNFKVAAALLKTVELRTWNQIGLFATVLALRTIVKRLLTWESAHLRRRGIS
jgi:uncharacterized membrane protein